MLRGAWPGLQRRRHGTLPPAAEARRGEGVCVRGVRQGLQPPQRPEAPHADSHGRTAVRLRDVWQALRPRQRAPEPHVGPRGAEARYEARGTV